MRVAILFAITLTMLPLVPLAAHAAAALPPGAEPMEAYLSSKLPPAAVAWAKREGAKEAGMPNASEGTARGAATTYGAFGGLQGADIDALVTIVMLEMARQDEMDLRGAIADMQKINQQKKSLRGQQAEQKAAQVTAKNQLRQQYAANAANGRIATPRSSLDDYLAQASVNKDSLGELDEQQQLKLQSLADRRAKAMDALSIMMKKMGDTQSSIVKNLK